MQTWEREFLMLNADDKKKFEEVLKKRIQEYFQQNKKNIKANGPAWLKVCILMLFWIVTLVLVYTIKSSFIVYLALYLLYGLSSLLVIFNISHDAVHETLSSKKWVNAFFSYTFNILGGNNYSWYLKHNIGHHISTNIHGRDMDIETTPLFRISPHSPTRWYYQFQHFYALPLYCTMSLFLIFVFDILVLFRIKPTNKSGHAWYNYVVLVFFKLIYIAYIIVIPSYLFSITLNEVIICFLFMHALLGLVISLVLLPSHFLENVNYYPFDKNPKLPSSWVMHQLLTTVDIAPESKTANILLGGLNSNVIHHIFPNIHHIHFLPIVKILKITAHEFNVPYKSYSFISAIKHHFLYLKKMGKYSKFNNLNTHHVN